MQGNAERVLSHLADELGLHYGLDFDALGEGSKELFVERLKEALNWKDEASFDLTRENAGEGIGEAFNEALKTAWCSVSEESRIAQRSQTNTLILHNKNLARKALSQDDGAQIKQAREALEANYVNMGLGKKGQQAARNRLELLNSRIEGIADRNANTPSRFISVATAYLTLSMPEKAYAQYLQSDLYGQRCLLNEHPPRREEIHVASILRHSGEPRWATLPVHIHATTLKFQQNFALAGHHLGDIGLLAWQTIQERPSVVGLKSVVDRLSNLAKIDDPRLGQELASVQVQPAHRQYVDVPGNVFAPGPVRTRDMIAGRPEDKPWAGQLGGRLAQNRAARDVAVNRIAQNTENSTAPADLDRLKKNGRLGTA